MVTTNHATCVVDAYGRQGMIGDAFNFIEKMPSPSVITWTSLLSACRLHVCGVLDLRGCPLSHGTQKKRGGDVHTKKMGTSQFFSMSMGQGRPLYYNRNLLIIRGT